MPAHTSHVLQPLDVGIFHIYKSAYRRAGGDEALKDVDFDWCSDATRNRVKMIARGLMGNLFAMQKFRIKRAFKKTGIYPPSLNSFLVHCQGVREVPNERLNDAKAALEAQKAAKKVRLQNLPRTNVRENLFHANEQPHN